MKQAGRFRVGPLHPQSSRLRRFLRFHGFRPRRKREPTRAILARFQRYAARPQTGNLDAATCDLLNGLRCSHPIRARSPIRELRALQASAVSPPRLAIDVLKNTPEIHVDSAAVKSRHPYEIVHVRWSRRSLRYALVGSVPRELGGQSGWNAVCRAFATWSSGGIVDFTEASSAEAEIRVLWTPGPSVNSDSIDPFYGAGGVVAVGYYPFPHLGELAGDLHLDTSETWSIDAEPKGLDLETVALHEIGHCLGIAHSRFSASIMWPAYKRLQHEVTTEDWTELARIYNGVAG